MSDGCQNYDKGQMPPRRTEALASGSSSATGYASRYEQLRANYIERQLAMCDQMLTEQGVPEWVMLSDSNGVPANSVPCRLKWYLARRKNVAAGEIDQQLQDEIKETRAWLKRKRHNAPGERPPTDGDRTRPEA